MAQFLLPRTGIGMDVHAFAPEGSGVPMHLACLEWPGVTGLAGHSDGDASPTPAPTPCSQPPG